MTSSNIFLSKPSLYQHILSLLEKCTHLSHLKQLQSYLVTLGHGQTQFFAFKLVQFSILSLTHLSYARLIFDNLDSPNIYLYTAMITAYASHSNSRSALLLYSRMFHLSRPRPNHFIFLHVLKSCSDGSSINDIRTVHTQILKSGFDGYVVGQTALVDSYSKCSDLETARRVFDEMSERNVVSWTAMVFGCARVGMVGDAVLLFKEMPERDFPSWNAVIVGDLAQNLRI